MSDEDPGKQAKKQALPEAFVAAQFKPGQSGNPSGRPEGSVSLITVLKRKLRENPETQNQIVQTLIDLATDKKDSRALQAVVHAFDRIDGLPARAEEDKGHTGDIIIQASGASERMLIEAQVAKARKAGNEVAAAFLEAQLEDKADG